MLLFFFSFSHSNPWVSNSELSVASCLDKRDKYSRHQGGRGKPAPAPEEVSELHFPVYFLPSVALQDGHVEEFNVCSKV